MQELVDETYGMNDLSDLVNVTDDLTNELLFGINKTYYYDLDSFEELSSKWNFNNNLSVLSLNIRSLTNKINKLSNILSHLSAPPTLICLQEIWSTSGNLNLEGYSSLEYYSREDQNAPNPNCGGGLVFILGRVLTTKKLTSVMK